MFLWVKCPISFQEWQPEDSSVCWRVELWLYRVRLCADVCRVDIINTGDLQFLTLSNLPDCTIDALSKLQVVCSGLLSYKNPSKDLNTFRNIKYAEFNCVKMKHKNIVAAMMCYF